MSMRLVKHYIKSFLFLELIQGMMVTGKYLFKRKITLQYPEQKTPLSLLALEGCMHNVVMPMEKNAVLPVSCVKQFVLH